VSVLIMFTALRRLAIEHTAPVYVSTDTWLCALEIENVNSICLQKTSVTTKCSKKSFTFGGSKFIAVVKLVALRDVPRFCNKPQERKQTTPVTRRKLRVFLLLAVVWRYVHPRAACWLTYPLLRVVKLEGARAATVE